MRIMPVMLFFVFTALVALGWILVSLLRRPCSLSNMIDQVDGSLACDLLPFLALRDPGRYCDDEFLWTTMGKTRGIWRMIRDCRHLFALTVVVAMAFREQFQDTAEPMLLTVFYLLMTLAASLIESSFKRQAPGLPRVMARASARLYCDFFAYVDAVRGLMELESSPAGTA